MLIINQLNKMAKTNKVATPKGKQAPNTEKKTTKKVAPKKEVVKEVKVVEKVVDIDIEKAAEFFSEATPYTEETAPVILSKEAVSVEIVPTEDEGSDGPMDIKAEYEKEWKETPIQTPLTESELEEKALEAHYASLGQIDFYNKNIKK